MAATAPASIMTLPTCSPARSAMSPPIADPTAMSGASGPTTAPTDSEINAAATTDPICFGPMLTPIPSSGR